MRLFYQITKYNDDGVIKKYKKRQAESFVKAFIYQLYSYTYWDQNSQKNDINGVSRNKKSKYLFNLNGLGGGGYERVYDTEVSSADVGVVVGSGNTAVASTDHCLDTKITYGVSAGKLESSGHVFSTVAISAPNASFTIDRVFRNSTGGNVTINEIGIYGSTDDGYIYMLVRDVLGSAIVAGNGDYIKITYTFQVTA